MLSRKPAQLGHPFISRLELHAGTAAKAEWLHLAGAFPLVGRQRLAARLSGVTGANPSFTVKLSAGQPPVIDVWSSGWDWGRQETYPAHEVALVTLAIAWQTSIERLFSPYRAQFLSRGRYAGTPYLWQKLSVGTGSGNEPLKPGFTLELKGAHA
jgi:hypothetical protein